ncbi:anti-sigma factor family protein [Actinokineospora bangkokensis]|uniref:Anti-sigma factor n=1 Tax=Actinokineospora bangkokensis TaxID=1193682 RepID=A0A1Q9LDM5_9PSEU|nr:anti-sigma factor [Actinokineospora bangkokensis]OLR90112.1 anti-sigma factor [Actinokineospora bangkokensis]
MTFGLSDQHLMPDAVVAFVDGELGRTPHDRATAHLARCPFCAAEVTAQRQARAAVRTAPAPSMPAGLLAALQAIPQEVDLPSAPDNLAVTDDGQLVAVQRPEALPTTPDKVPFGASAPLGSSPRLGQGPTVLGRKPSRRAAQGAGVVVSGLVLGALALVNTGPSTPPTPAQPQPDIEPAGFLSTPTPPLAAQAPTFGLVAAR